MKKKLIIGALILGVAGFAMMTKKSGNNLEAKRKGEVPLSDTEAQNYLNTYSDLAPYYNSHSHLQDEFGSMIEWAKYHWANHGMHEGRTFESSVPIY